MNRFFTTIVLFVLFFSFDIQASELIKVYSLPKSGTHLIKTILSELNEINPSDSIGHLTDVHGHPLAIEGKRVVNIRDLRDYFVSLKHFTNKVVNIGIKRGEHWPGFKPIDQYQNWLSMTDNEQLMALITLDENIPYWEENITNNIYLTDLQVQQSEYNSDILITKYELWIGEKGGGTADAFFKQFKSFLNHFGYDVSPKECERVYENFYGQSLTFDKGKIGRWKEEFNEEHVLAFKQKWNNYLVSWGYEKNEDWE